MVDQLKPFPVRFLRKLLHGAAAEYVLSALVEELLVSVGETNRKVLPEELSALVKILRSEQCFTLLETFFMRRDSNGISNPNQ